MGITLAAIVRNEAATIVRMLDSVANDVDRIVIVDTGSTDDTEALVKEWADWHPGTEVNYLHDEWVNFGHNRRELIIEAQKRIGADLHHEWILLADADFTLEFAAGWRAALVEQAAGIDCLQVPVTEADVSYRYRALVRADVDWKYEGVTHEVLDCSRNKVENFDGVRIVHHHDGGMRGDKFQRDRDLLEAIPPLERNAREWFYLAQTYACLAQTGPGKDLHLHLAIEAYRTRVEMGGWAEEVYYSLYRIGKLQGCVSTLLEAWSYRPTRLEALYEAATLLRAAPRAVIALLEPGEVTNACHSDPISQPAPDDILFVEPWVYDYGLAHESALAWHNLGEFGEARMSYNYLLTLDLPDNYRDSVVENLGKLDAAG